jgi:hypothetical protein
MTLIEKGNSCRNIIVAPGNNELITIVVTRNTELKTMMDSVRKQRLYTNKILIEEHFFSIK